MVFILFHLYDFPNTHQGKDAFVYCCRFVISIQMLYSVYAVIFMAARLRSRSLGEAVRVAIV